MGWILSKFQSTFCFYQLLALFIFSHWLAASFLKTNLIVSWNKCQHFIEILALTNKLNRLPVSMLWITIRFKITEKLFSLQKFLHGTKIVVIAQAYTWQRHHINCWLCKGTIFRALCSVCFGLWSQKQVKFWNDIKFCQSFVL